MRIAFLLFLMLSSAPARAETSLFETLMDRIRSSIGAQASGHKVIGIADGDTLTVLKERKEVKIRLGEIDAPERQQAFGQRAKESLQQLCAGKSATYETQDVDRYGRVVARVHCNGIDVNQAQVERGMAWVYTKYSKDAALFAMEVQARAEQRGLWADRNPVPPWEWRKKARRN